MQHPTDEPFFSYDSLFYNFIVPYVLYFIWAMLYCIFHFSIKKEKIVRKKYETLYNYFHSDAVPWAHKKLTKAGGKAWFVFMQYHMGYFTVSHITAVMCFYSMTIHSIFVTLYLTVGIWNGSCYYTRFFDYTKKLKYMQQQQMQIMNEALNQRKTKMKKNETADSTPQESDSSQNQV